MLEIQRWDIVRQWDTLVPSVSLIGECTALELLPIDLLGRTEGPPVVGCASYDSGKVVLKYIIGWINESFTVTLMVVATLRIGDPVPGKGTLHIFGTYITKMFGTQSQSISGRNRAI